MKIWKFVKKYAWGFFVILLIILLISIKNIFTRKGFYGNINEIDNKIKKRDKDIERREKRIARRKKIEKKDIKHMDINTANATTKRINSRIADKLKRIFK